MLKIIIADDEKKIIQLLKCLVDWTFYNIEIVATATNGKDAFELIKKHKPDIVITDIRMPIINGIELVKLTKESGLFPFFIIISGYSDFEYAQQAIHLGVSDYLLKPINKKDLEQTLIQITQRVCDSQHEIAEKELLTSSLERTSTKAKSNLLIDLISNRGASLVFDEPKKLKDEYGISFSKKYFFCILLHIFPENYINKNTGINEFRFAISKLKDSLLDKMSEILCESIWAIYNNEVYLLVNSDEDIEALIIKKLEKMRLNVLELQSIFPNIHIALGISEPFFSFSSIPEEFESAHEALLNRFTNLNCFIFKSTKSNLSTFDNKQISEYQKKLSEQIKFLNIDGVTETLHELNEYLHVHSFDGMMMKECYISIVESFILYFRTLEDTTLFNKFNSEYFANALDAFYSFDKSWNWMIQTCTDLLIDYKNEKESAEDKPIRQAKSYINEHYNEPISLESVSNEIGFNPAYFSALFKRITGQNFIDYVKEIRIEHAKTLLLHTNHEISEIAREVGYSDVKYFSRLFRSITHLTPSEFRKTYG